MADRPAMPKTVKVGPFTYVITIDQPEVDHESVEHQAKFAGFSDHMTGRIVIAEGLGADHERETLLHEIIHIAMAASGLTSRSGEHTNEDFVAGTSPFLFAALKDNPNLTAYLLG